MFKFGSKKDINIDYKCTIRLLDDTEVLQCDFQCEHKGQFLLDYTCNALNLLEKDYFGLRYVDVHKQRHWLDPTRSILKQVKGMNPIVFCFRVKFYPQDPHRLGEEITRYQIFLQLRRDLLHGRLYCSQSDAAWLAAYIIQSELGDYDPEEHPSNYVSEFKLLLKQTQRIEDKIADIHQTLRGQVPAVAEMNFLRKACLLDTYGVDPHPVKDHKGNQLYLGINYAGILTFQGSRKTHHLKWPDIQKINYEGKMFIVHLLFSEDARTKKKHLVGFKCPSQAACHHLWKCAVEQRYFFTMESSSEVPQVTTSGGIFSRGCKFRYSGRVEKEIVEDTKSIKREQPQFQRSLTRPPSFRCKMADGYSSSPSTTPHDDHITDYNGMIYTNHTTSNNMYTNSTDQETLQMNHANMTPSTPNAPSDGLDILEEECDSYSPTDTVHSESPTFNSQSCDNSHLQQSLDEERDDSDTAEDLPESLEADASPYPAPAYRQLDDIVPLDVKIPKRKVPMAPSTALPLHVNVMRVIVLASLFVLLLLSCLLIVVMESDSSLFSDIRKLPEMIILRREYYEPAKDYIVEQMNFMFKR